MSTFVLVPDAEPVAALLLRSGHAVHSASPDDVATVLERHDLTGVVLVGHDGAGAAIGAVASARVAQQVYFDDGPRASTAAAPARRRVYVHCTQRPEPPRVRLGEPGWEVTDLPAGDRPLDEQPDLVAALLEGLAATA
ncbi:MAG TPA: hypothetical protein VN238_10615 [Solirubrobacteraceae bacterium]|nr:hypothetical protein [Solirubrobacteraceae bacterium]